MQTTTARPRFRQDLVAELVEDGGQRFIDVADPDSGHMYRFFEVEYSLACGMDGQRDVAGIVKWAQDELGFSPTANEVQAVIAQLANLSFVGADRSIDTAATKVAAAQKADDLAKGIVVGKNASASPSVDVELGRAGTNATSREDKLPSADFALGASGAGAARPVAKAPVEDIALGAPGANEPRRPASASTPPSTPATDMSLDLADQFALKPGDVKEAVRQSKVMTAVEVPKELLEAEAMPAKPVAKPEPVVAKPSRRSRSQSSRRSRRKSRSRRSQSQSSRRSRRKSPSRRSRPTRSRSSFRSSPSWRRRPSRRRRRRRA